MSLRYQQVVYAAALYWLNSPVSRCIIISNMKRESLLWSQILPISISAWRISGSGLTGNMYFCLMPVRKIVYIRWNKKAVFPYFLLLKNVESAYFFIPFKQSTKKDSVRNLFWSIMVERIGIEPMTPCVQSRCSPSWANTPCILKFDGGPEWTWTNDLTLIRGAL